MFIPDISCHKMKAIRYFSKTNKWLDFVILVDESIFRQACVLAQQAIDSYWDGHYECYGDALNYYLGQLNAPYILIAHDCDNETDEYEDWWRKILAGIFMFCHVEYLED